MVVSRHQNPSVILIGSHVAAGIGTVVPFSAAVFVGAVVFFTVAVFAGTTVFAGAGDGVFWIAAGVLVALADLSEFNSNMHPAPDMDRTSRKTRASVTIVRMCGNRLRSQKTFRWSCRERDGIFPCWEVDAEKVFHDTCLPVQRKKSRGSRVGRNPVPGSFRKSEMGGDPPTPQGPGVGGPLPHARAGGRGGTPRAVTGQNGQDIVVTPRD